VSEAIMLCWNWRDPLACDGTYRNGWQQAKADRMCQWCGQGPQPIEFNFDVGRVRWLHAASLRRRGLSYRTIGEAMHICAGQARRIAHRGERILAEFDDASDVVGT
jgi:hypothetical protein